MVLPLFYIENMSKETRNSKEWIRNSKSWIKIDKYRELEVGDILTVRYFVHKAKVLELPTENEVKVQFIAGPMVIKGEVALIRQQIHAVNQ